jgi:hypothetical protein
MSSDITLNDGSLAASFTLDQLVLILRALTGDLDTPYDYTDSKLRKLLGAAAGIVISDISLYRGYSVSSIDPSTGVFSIGGEIDETFSSLITLKASCLLNTAQAAYNARYSGFSAWCDRSRISASEGSGLWDLIINKGPCESYKELKREVLLRRINQGLNCKAILSTFSYTNNGGCRPSGSGRCDY